MPRHSYRRNWWAGLIVALVITTFIVLAWGVWFTGIVSGLLCGVVTAHILGVRT